MFKQEMINAHGSRKVIKIHKMNDGDILVKIAIFRPDYRELAYVVKAEDADKAGEEFTRGA